MKVLQTGLLMLASAMLGATLVLLWERVGVEWLEAPPPYGYEAKLPRASVPEAKLVDALPTPLVAIIADPERFHGRRVQVIGFLALGGDNVLYLDKQSFDAANTDNAVALALGWDFVNREAPAVSDRYAILEGTFDAQRKGHLGVYRGSLRDITRLGTWPGRHPFDADRQRWLAELPRTRD